MTALESIRAFVAEPRFAFAGVSRRADDFSRSLFREFLNRGYDPVPVHPSAAEIEGRRCFPRVKDIQPPVDSVLLMTPSSASLSVAADCAQAGVRRVWFYRGAGTGAIDPEAVEFCTSIGMEVIPGECPFMFLPGAGWIHRLHGLARKVRGTYPA